MDPEVSGGPSRPWWRRPRNWGIGAAILVLGVFGFVYLQYIDWPAKPSDPPPVFLDAAGDQPDLVGSTYMYDFWGNFIDQQHLWRVEAKPELLPLVMREFGALELASVDEMPDAFWSQPPYWWKPKRNRPGR